jgi:hypothetical protein
MTRVVVRRRSVAGWVRRRHFEPSGCTGGHEHPVMGVKNGSRAAQSLQREALGNTTGNTTGNTRGKTQRNPRNVAGRPVGRRVVQPAARHLPPLTDRPTTPATTAPRIPPQRRPVSTPAVSGDGFRATGAPPPHSPPSFSSPPADEPLAARTRAVEPAGRVDARHRDRASFRLGGAARHRRTRPLGRRWLLVGALAMLVGVVLAGSALAARSGTDDQPAMPGQPASTVELAAPEGNRREPAPTASVAASAQSVSSGVPLAPPPSALSGTLTAEVSEATPAPAAAPPRARLAPPAVIKTLDPATAAGGNALGSWDDVSGSAPSSGTRTPAE